MIETHVAPLEALQIESIKALLAATPPCVTLFLPPYRPAEQSKPSGVILRSWIQDLSHRLEQIRIGDAEAAAVLAPIASLAEDPAFTHGSHSGRVIFSSPDLFRQFELTEPVRASWTIGGCFEIRPILNELNFPSQYFVLKLSTQRVELLRATALTMESVVLPKGVPSTLEATMAFEPPDHDLENRSAAGPSTGAMRGVRFGTGSGRETGHTYVADFYKAVDKGIHQLLRDGKTPLVLAGVEEDTTLYRGISTYPGLVEKSVGGDSGGAQTNADLLRHASAILHFSMADEAARDLMEARERLGPGRSSMDLEIILSAAAEGRVSRIYIDENAEKTGVFLDVKRGTRRNWGGEDLLNVAAVDTILHGGMAFALPTSQMPTHAAVAAIFRY